MTVLPYVTVSIIGGLGALDAAQARTLGKRVGLILPVLWAVALAAVLLFPADVSARIRTRRSSARRCSRNASRSTS